MFNFHIILHLSRHCYDHNPYLSISSGDFHPSILLIYVNTGNVTSKTSRCRVYMCSVLQRAPLWVICCRRCWHQTTESKHKKLQICNHQFNTKETKFRKGFHGFRSFIIGCYAAMLAPHLTCSEGSYYSVPKHRGREQNSAVMAAHKSPECTLYTYYLL